MMNLKNKTLALVVASALVMPSALAVEGSDGMHYTSAGEGFYASVRVRFNSGGKDGANAGIENSSSRLGIQGTSEMSHGLEGFYRYEAAFGVNDGDGKQDGNGDGVQDDGSNNFVTRLAYVGLRGGFGSVRVGSDWADEYNFVVGSTDIANVGSGWFAYNDDYAGRADGSIHYKSPDFNGLQVAARFELDGGNDNNPDGVQGAEDSELDAWALSAKYEFSGFTVGGMYITRPDYINAYTTKDSFADQNMEDKTAWALRGSYGQDNWGVSTWYGENNTSDFGYHVENAAGDTTMPGDAMLGFQKQDETVFSIAGNVNIGPTGVYVVHETKENLRGLDDALTSFGVEYKFNSKAKTWIEYAAQDFETDENAEDYVTIGLRHDF